MRWKAYSKYKPSDVEWLETTPYDWPVERLRFHVKVNPTKAEASVVSSHTQVSFFPMEAVGEYGGLRMDHTRNFDDVASGYTYFCDGDVVVAKITPCFENGKGAIAKGLKNGIGFGTTELHVLRPELDIYYKYLFYLTISYAFRSIGAAYMYGAGGQKRVPENFIKNLRHPIPSLNEQRFIASFLDRETGRIDALIEKKERQIELLQEKRAALISHAVTNGLNPNVKMKDSRIEWLGEIPEHWGILRLKFVSSVTTGDKDTVDNIKEGKYPFFVRSQTIERINTFTYDGEAVLTAGDGVGVAKVFHHINGKFDFHQRVYKFSDFKHMTGRFFYYYIKTNFHKEVLKLSAKSTVDSLRLPMIQDFRFAIPPITEQHTITEYLDKKTSEIDRLIQTVYKSMDMLREYRTALISAAVTGKIDVRKETA